MSSSLPVPFHKIKCTIAQEIIRIVQRSFVHYLIEEDSIHSGNIKMFYSLSSADFYFSSTPVIELIHLYAFSM